MNTADRRRVPRVVLLIVAVAACTPAVAWAADDLAIAKIGLHLVPGVPGPGACGFVPEVRCADSPWNEPFTVEGGLEEDYVLYVIAFDINRSAGLASASFTIAYDPGVVVGSWRSCADEVTTSPEWPDSGSHVELGFTTCAGTQPVARDPEGDGAVLLGAFHVWAASKGRFAIGALDTETRSAEVRDCAGMTTNLEWLEDRAYWGNVALGEVAFGGDHALSACEFPGVADDPCLAGWSTVTYRCCFADGGCVGGMSQASLRACEYAGGVWRQVKCSLSCYDPDCLAVPVKPSTWGMIKARY